MGSLRLPTQNPGSDKVVLQRHYVTKPLPIHVLAREFVTRLNDAFRKPGSTHVRMTSQGLLVSLKHKAFVAGQGPAKVPIRQVDRFIQLRKEVS